MNVLGPNESRVFFFLQGVKGKGDIGGKKNMQTGDRQEAGDTLIMVNKRKRENFQFTSKVR